ncbi:MAG: hypothetical protein JWP25_8987 [Bradyrhizobium sp.]|nr:hypothetical protein [Bradyrhizobium sp.]
MKPMSERSEYRRNPHPSQCPHCEYDRRFPGFEGGGWMQQDNNGPIVSCPMCNDDGAYPARPTPAAEGG